MKHKKMRGVVAMLLTLVMVVGMLPTSVYASDTDGGGDSVVLESVSDLIEVSSVNKSHLPEKQVALLLCEARCWLRLRHAKPSAAARRSAACGDASAWGLSWGVASQGMRLPIVPRAQEASQSIVGVL